MKRFATICFLMLGVVALATPAFALRISIAPDHGNPASPQMGDRLRFHTAIQNDGHATQEGVLAWISLVETDSGKEQPVDLEDWSAHKAVVSAALLPGQTVETIWPMRLIKAGSYRVVVSAMSRNGETLTASPFVDFTVRQKPVVESSRIVPVALGAPLFIAGLLIWRLRENRARA